MPLVQQCGTFAHHQYATQYNTETVEEYNSGKGTGDSKVEDKSKCKKKLWRPNRLKQLIDEILTLSEICQKVPGREFDGLEGIGSHHVILKQERRRRMTRTGSQMQFERLLTLVSRAQR